jgi:8-oxo-dGTP pyrophosphatase MutT (NUDIX family)
VTALRPDAAWLDRLHARLDRPPLRPRVPLAWRGQAIGSVEPGVPAALPLPGLWRPDGAGWEVTGDSLTPSLDAIGLALESAGLAHVRRNEQLPVCNASGEVLGTVERGVVRALGIPTRAVHLLGFAPDGRQWVQQRALTKANDPGLWDTMMGGMVPACDSLEAALARETWEEAGLRLDQLQDLRHGGFIMTRRPTAEPGPGYVVERIDWFRSTVPDGLAPVNQDGEVAQFVLIDAAELLARAQRDEFTLEAAMLVAACCGWDR